MSEVPIPEPRLSDIVNDLSRQVTQLVVDNSILRAQNKVLIEEIEKGSNDN